MSNYFLKTKKNDDFFCSEYNDEYLSTLFDFFTDGSSLIQIVKNNLLNPKFQGMSGNRTFVRINEQKVTIGSLYDSDPDEWAITIDRAKLLELIDKWQELIKLKPDEILFKRMGSCIKIEPIFYEKE